MHRFLGLYNDSGEFVSDSVILYFDGNRLKCEDTHKGMSYYIFDGMNIRKTSYLEICDDAMKSLTNSEVDVIRMYDYTLINDSDSISTSYGLVDIHCTEYIITTDIIYIDNNLCCFFDKWFVCDDSRMRYFSRLDGNTIELQMYFFNSDSWTIILDFNTNNVNFIFDDDNDYSTPRVIFKDLHSLEPSDDLIVHLCSTDWFVEKSIKEYLGVKKYTKLMMLSGGN